eukprot:130293-Alexandrium_andersonii.AAC.1
MTVSGPILTTSALPASSLFWRAAMGSTVPTSILIGARGAAEPPRRLAEHRRQDTPAHLERNTRL